MNLETIQNITLDFIVPRIQNVRCVEDDHNSRTINILITKNGTVYPLDNKTMTARYKIHKPDHTYIYNDALINDDGSVTIKLSDQAMSVVGVTHSELQISDSKNILSTMPFNIIVEKSVLSNKDIESKNESDVINGMINHLIDYDNPHKTDKKQIGLENCDNTSDADKPISTAQQIALDLKANTASPTLTGTPKAPTASAGTNTTQIATTAFTQTEIANHNTSPTAHFNIRSLISDLTTRLNALADSDDTTLDQLSEIVAYIKSNRTLIENVTTNKVNVSDIVDNLTSTSTNKPLSAKQGKVLKDLIDSLTTVVGNKVDKVSGKGLSTNDYTTNEKNKLSGISVGANVNVQSDWNTTNTTSDSFIKNKPAIPTKISELINDSGYLTSDTIVSTSRINLPRVTKNVSYQPGANRLVCEEFSSNSEGLPSAHFYHALTGQGSDANYNTQLAIGMTTTAMHYRNRQNGTWGEWNEIILAKNGVLNRNITTPSYLRVGTNSGTGVELAYNNEGGNVAWFSPDGTK
ncbi:MAG: phage baseplate upper protein, partial [Lachnospiraceae bacterium]|nr:phage baseplate upper protein [Lachnospiraceae bacterium]